MFHTNGRLIGLGCGVIFVFGACGGGGAPASVALPCDPGSRTCYVRASGRGLDTNTGADKDHALGTIRKAASLARNGYKIIVGPGRYEETEVTTASVGTAPQGLQFIADVAGNFTGDTAGAVTVMFNGSGSGAGFNLFSSLGSLIDGFTITGFPDAGIVVKSGSDDFTIQNCIISGNSGDGIRVQDSASVLVFNNLIYRNGGVGVGIVGKQSGSPNARVYSNTVVGNADHGIILGTTSAPSPNASVHNNIIQDNDHNAPQESIKAITNPRSDVFPAPDIPDYNLVSPATYSPANLQGAHDLHTPAVFVDLTGGDFHVPVGSPVVNAGGVLNVDDSLIRGLRSRTVVAGGAGDTGQLDIGFHYLR